MFAIADVDCDGKLGYKEFLTMLQPHKHPTEQTNTAKKVTIQLPSNYCDNVKEDDIEESNKNENGEETNAK